MSPKTLLAGNAWVQSKFYSRRSIWRRIWQAFGYLSPSIILRALAPLNVGYRWRHQAYGTFEKGKAFVPPQESRDK